jgi:hypothetical protein
MKTLYYLRYLAGIFLLSQSWAADRHYISRDAEACVTLPLKCEENQKPFVDEQGCGCQTQQKQTYISKDPQACLTLKFDCETGLLPFFDEQGCGCQVGHTEGCQTAKKAVLSVPLKYQRLEIEEAGITFEIPEKWFEQPEKTLWSPERESTTWIGFQWKTIPSDWAPNHLLPKNSKSLGPYMIDLGWERGLLYMVQIIAQKKQPNRFEIHMIIPRMEAQIAYDFYASAPQLAVLEQIEAAYQHFIQSGVLKSIRRYISKDLKACEDETFALDCQVSEEEFFDEVGCGCLIAPSEEAVYDN